MPHVALKDEPLQTHHGVLHVAVDGRGKLKKPAQMLAGSDSAKIHLRITSFSSSGEIYPPHSYP